MYDLCKHCDHFVDADGHLCDEVDRIPDDDHKPEPRGTPKSLCQWQVERPDLFFKHSDGLIGPNSRFHVYKSEET